MVLTYNIQGHKHARHANHAKTSVPMHAKCILCMPVTLVDSLLYKFKETVPHCSLSCRLSLSIKPMELNIINYHLSLIRHHYFIMPMKFGIYYFMKFIRCFNLLVESQNNVTALPFFLMCVPNVSFLNLQTIWAYQVAQL